MSDRAPVSIHPAMPTITFSDGTDLDGLFAVLHYVNKGLGATGPGQGMSYQFALTGGTYHIGTYAGHRGDDLLIALHEDGSPTGEVVAVDSLSLITVTYL